MLTSVKASKQLGMIFRMTKYFRNILCLKTLYCSLVRSILEYGSVVWAPFYTNEKNRIEAVQRKFTRFALRHFPHEPRDYASRCSILKLDFLTIRRDLAKATFVSDLLRSDINCPLLVGQLNINIRRRTLRSYAFLTLPFARTNYAFNEPLSSMCRVLNRCYSSFDLNYSRPTQKLKFLTFLRDENPLPLDPLV